MSIFEDAISKMSGNSMSTPNGLEDYYEMGFTPSQVSEIQKGLMFGLDVGVYAKLEYEPEHMSSIRELVLAGYDVSAFDLSY